MADNKTAASFRLSAPTVERLERFAERWHSDKTGVIEHAVSLLDVEPAIIGGEVQAAEQALRAWACLIERASADNDKTFTRAEWNYLADVNNGCSPVVFALSMGNPGTHFWANAEDGHRLDGTGANWFAPKEAGKCVAKLVEKIRSLDYAHQWAMVIAVQWFWDHAQDNIDHQEDPWWTLAFRKGHKT